MPSHVIYPPLRYELWGGNSVPRRICSTAETSAETIINCAPVVLVPHIVWVGIEVSLSLVSIASAPAPLVTIVWVIGGLPTALVLHLEPLGSDLETVHLRDSGFCVRWLAVGNETCFPISTPTKKGPPNLARRYKSDSCFPNGNTLTADMLFGEVNGVR